MPVASLIEAGGEEPGGEGLEGGGEVDQPGVDQDVMEEAAEGDAAVEALVPGCSIGTLEWGERAPATRAAVTNGARTSAPSRAIVIPWPPSGSIVPWQSPA